MSKNKILLKDLCIPNDWGKYGIPASAEDYDIAKTRYLRITDISDDGELLNNDKKSVSASDLDKYLLNEGDIVFARTGNSTGRSYFHEAKNGKLAFAGFLIKYALDWEKVNPKYLKYYTISNEYKNWVKNLSVGSTRGNINAQTFGDCPITVPERKQQDLIVNTLSLLIDKIELNNRINAKLEAMAKTLYDYWFVQFDFPYSPPSEGCPQDGVGIGKPYKNSGGKMVWNEELKREIPEGWEVKPLKGIVTLVKDIVLPGDLKPQTHYIGLEHIPRKSIVLSNWETAEKVDSAKCSFKKNDILFGKIRPYFHKVGVSFTEGITSTDTIVLRAKTADLHGIVLQTVFSDDFVLAATQSSTGSKMPRADWNILKNYPIVIPPKEIRMNYQLVSSGIINKLENSVIQNQQLSALRDWLLPMLMNGQVTVGDSAENKANYIIEEEMRMAAEPENNKLLI